MTATTALIVIDLQLDFLPGGALGVAGGDEIVAPICELAAADRFDVVVATQDWHPPDHVSFASNHTGRRPFDEIELYGRRQILWPDHCVQGSPGAELHPALPMASVTAIIRKGTDPLVDSYSTFRHNWNAAGERPRTGLGGFLTELGVGEVWLVGLARDFCVRWSAEDAVEAGFLTRMIWELSRSVDPGDDAALRSDLAAAGVRIE